MSAYQWPGNVRELQNVIEREMILSNEQRLTISELSSSPEPQPMNHYKLSDVEKAHIERVLVECHWKIGGKNGAAIKLDLPDSTLRSRMIKLGIQRS